MTQAHLLPQTPAPTHVAPAPSPLSECIKFLLEQERAIIASIGHKLADLYAEGEKQQKNSLREIYAVLRPLYEQGVSALDAYEMDLSRLLEAEQGKFEYLTGEQLHLLRMIPDSKRVPQIRLFAFSRAIDRPSTQFASHLQGQIKSLFASMYRLGWDSRVNGQAFDQAVQKIGQFLCGLGAAPVPSTDAQKPGGIDWSTLLLGFGTGIATSSVAPSLLSDLASFGGEA